MKKRILLIGLIITVFLLVHFSTAKSFNENDAREIGWELLNNNEVLHIWNTQNDYFFDANSGIQFTNYYEEYWTKNVFCMGYKTDEWHYICNDAVNFDWTIESDDTTFVTITGFRFISFLDKQVKVGLKYHLELNDKELSVIPSIKNSGTSDINVDIGFAWRVKDIRINNDVENDKLFINNSVYQLNEALDLRFTDMTKLVKHYTYSYYYNGTYKETIKTNDYNYTIKIPFYKIKDRANVDLRWNENLNYFVEVKSTSQYNAPITLGINAGSLAQGQTKSTVIYWSDATGKVPMIYYRFENDATDEGDGGLGYTLTEVNTPTYGTGKIDTAIDFEETAPASYASKTDCTGSEITKIRTIDFWFKPEDISSGDATFAIGYEYNNQMKLVYGGDAKIDLDLTIGASQKWFLGSNTVFLQGEWYHIIIVTGSGGAKLYINGSTTPEDTDASTEVIGSWAGIYVGMSLPDFTGDGMIDNFALFDEEYDTDDVTWSWNSGAGRDFTPPAPPAYPITVTLNAPDDSITNDTLVNNFLFTPVSYQYDILNCTLFHNESTGPNLLGYEVINTTAITNNSANTLTDTFADYGVYIWNVQCCDSNYNCNSSGANRTLTLNPISPTTTLNYPADNSFNDSTNITFNCSVVAGSYNLTNMSIFGNFTGSWLLNETVKLNRTGNSSVFNINLTPEVYVWNCVAYDDYGNYDWGNSNFTLNINSFFDVYLSDPADNLTTVNSSLDLSANLSVLNYELINTTLYVWYPNGSIFNTNYTALSGSENSTINLSIYNLNLILYENYTWNYEGCAKKFYGDPNGECEWASNNRSFAVTSKIDAEFWENNTYETQNEIFEINISLPSTITLFLAKLVYNGTNYTVSDITLNASAISNIYYLKREIDIPLVTTDRANLSKDKHFYWSFNYSGVLVGVKEENTEIKTQTVTSVLLTSCNVTFDIPSINFTLKEETGDHKVIEGINQTVNNTWATAWEYYLGDGSIYKTYNTLNVSTNVSDIDFCIYPENLTYISNLDMEYESEGYVPREYYLEEAGLTNNTNEINLYLFDADEAVKFFFNLKEGYENIDQATITISKYIVGDGTYLVIGKRKSDSDGNFIEYLDLDKKYRFVIVKDLSSLGIADIVSKCEEAPCEIDINLAGAMDTIWQKYDEIYAKNVDYNLTFNTTTKMVTYRFIDVTGLAQYGRLLVEQIKFNESYKGICDSSTHATIGTLTCNLSTYTDGRFTAKAYISRSPEKLVDFIGIVISRLKEALGAHGLLITLFIVIVVAFAGFYQPVVGIILTIVALFVSSLIGFVSLGFTTLFLLIAIAVIIIIKMRS